MKQKGIKKPISFGKVNKKHEMHFHDEWALSVAVEEIDARAPFEGGTSPEYESAMKALGDMRNKSILNIGSGLGEEAVYMALKGAKVTAIDLSPEMVSMTRRLAKVYKVRNIRYFVMDAEKLEFKDQTFDGVLGCAVLHHGNIKKMIKQTSRVLKKGGTAVFVEPLKYNPVINIYRKMATSVRTEDEHPLGKEDIDLISRYFSKTQTREFQFFTLIIFVWFYFIERLHPNNARYWKKIVWEKDKYEKYFKLLLAIDNILLKLSFLRKYCWVVVIKSIK